MPDLKRGPFAKAEGPSCFITFFWNLVRGNVIGFILFYSLHPDVLAGKEAVSPCRLNSKVKYREGIAKPMKDWLRNGATFLDINIESRDA